MCRYDETGFTVNGIDVPSSIVCVGGLAGSWKPTTMADITPERYGVGAMGAGIGGMFAGAASSHVCSAVALLQPSPV